jgi:hypothetical protein
MWETRAEATAYKCANEKVAADVRKMLKDKAKKKYTNDDILKAINKDSQLNLNIESGKYSKGDNEIVDKVEWKKGLSANTSIDKQVVFVDFENILAPTNKTIPEAKGLITADYQNHLEKQWIASLRSNKAQQSQSLRQRVHLSQRRTKSPRHPTAQRAPSPAHQAHAQSQAYELAPPTHSQQSQRSVPEIRQQVQHRHL